MAPPDQIIGRTGLEAFGFTSGHLNGDRPSTLTGQIPASISRIAAVGTAALTTTVALSAFGATGGAAALAQLRPTQRAASTKGRAALSLSAAEGAAPFTAASIRTAGIGAA
jgi:hypothetical protein